MKNKSMGKLSLDKAQVTKLRNQEKIRGRLLLDQSRCIQPLIKALLVLQPKRPMEAIIVQQLQ